MKETVSCSIDGKKCRGKVLGCVMVFLAALVPLELSLMNLDSPHKNPRLALTVAAIVVFSALFALAVVFIAATLLKIVIPTVSFRDKPFSLSGKAGPLSVRCAYDGEPIRFLGHIGQLAKHFLFAFLVPVAAWAFSFRALLGKTDAVIVAAKKANPSVVLHIAFCIVVFFMLFIIVVPFFCLVVRWLVNFRWKTFRLKLADEMPQTVMYVSKQALLSVVTLGVLWPLQTIRTWRYFTGRTSLLEQAEADMRMPSTRLFRFEGNTRKGFSLLWGQTLLCIVSLGIYSPWAFARCTRYFIENTVLVDRQ